MTKLYTFYIKQIFTSFLNKNEPVTFFTLLFIYCIVSYKKGNTLKGNKNICNKLILYTYIKRIYKMLRYFYPIMNILYGKIITIS